jgi:DNA-binding transcriptional MocR family regulator
MRTTSNLSGPDLAHALGPWRRTGAAYVALADALRSLVLDGRLAIRGRLPSERELAVALGVSRTTTTAAYDVLRDQGYLESRRGSGSRVALPTGGVLDREFAGPSSESPAGAIDLTIAALPAPGAMTEAVSKATRDLAGYLGSTGYDPRGLPAFRHAVADHFVARGVPTREDQIVITSGAQHALALLLEVLVAPGDAVLVESPTYPNAFEAIRRVEGRLLPVAMADGGWDVDRLAAGLVAGSPRLAYLIPDFQNPTGFLMTDAERAEVSEACRRAGTPLVVDETFSQLDLEPWRPTPAPTASYGRDTVITIGSMSKAYWGGLRVGWIRCAPALAYRLARSRAGLDLATPVLDQLVAIHLLRASEAVLAERRSLLGTRRDALVSALQRELPAWSFVVPRGGLSLWVELEDAGSRALAEAAKTNGVRIIPGPTFAADDTLENRVRLPFTQPPHVLEEATVRLAAAQRRLASRTQPYPGDDPASGFSTHWLSGR